MTDLAGAGVRVLLIGTAQHDGPTLSSVPAVARTFEDVRTVLIEQCGVAPPQLRALLDPADARTMAAAVAEEANRAETVLLVYFIGHGLLGRGNELYLAASSTDQLIPGLAEHQAMSFSALRQAVGASRASSVVVILDCCFSGRVSLGARPSSPAFDTGPGHGLYFIGSAEQLALAPQDATHTAFSGAMIEVLTQGDPRGPRSLTLDAVYDAVFQAMGERHLPLPRRNSADRSGGLVIAPNPAVPTWTPALDPDETPAASGRCPYAGLAAFDVDDAELYCGRERMVRRIVDAVAETARESAGSGPLILVGSSGSGKTSLLNAGFLAELRADGLPDVPGSAGWPSVRITPGAKPLQRMITQLGGDAGVESLRDDPARIVGLVTELLAGRPGQRLILLIDQLEELFTLCHDPAEREMFLQAVSALASPAGGEAPTALVVLSLRADFYGRAAEHPELVGALRDHQLLVEPMVADELRAAIERPADRAGLALDEGLADVILHELGVHDGRSMIGALPLLSHVLWAIWWHRTGSRLTVAGYRTAGGITQAIATSAEQFYAGLPAEGQSAIRRVLPRLVRVGDERDDTAQPVELAALLRGLPDVPAAQDAVDRLTEARLLTLDRDTARISHEALLRHWPRLQGWLNADRDWLHARQQLDDDARSWQQAEQDPSLLYRGNRLAAVRQRAADAPADDPDLAPVSAAFLAACEHQERREAQRRRRRVVVLATLAVVAVIGLIVAAWQWQLAARQRDTVASSAAGQAADRLRETSPGLAMRIAQAARQVADTPEARTSVFNAALTPYDTRLTGHTGTVGTVEYHPGRNLLASADEDAAVRLWDLSDGGQPRTTAVLHSEAPTDIAFSPDGRFLATGDTGEDKQLWDISDPGEPVVAAQLPGARGAGLSFSPDGRSLAAVTEHEVALWDLTDHTHPVRKGALSLTTSDVADVSFSSDGGLLAIALGPPPGDDAGDFRTELLDVADPARPTAVTTLPDTHALAVDFSPRAPLLAVGGTRGADMWDVSDPARPEPVSGSVAMSSTGAVNSVAFSADGSNLAIGVSSGADGNNISIFSVDGGETDPVADYPMSTLVNSVAFGEDAESVFSSGSGSDIHFWNGTHAPRIPRDRPSSVGMTNDWSFTPDGRILVMPDPDDDRERTFGLWRTRGTREATRVGRLTSGSEYSDITAINDRTLLETDLTGVARLWNIADPTRPVRGAVLGTMGALGGDTTTHSGRTVAVHGDDGLVHLWDVTDVHAPIPLSTVAGPAGDNDGSIGLSGDGRILSVADQGSGRIQLWRLADRRHPAPAATISTEPRFPFLAGALGGGPGKSRTLVVTTARTTPHEIHLWDINDVSEPVHARTPPVAENDLVLSDDGKTLAVMMPNTIDLWNIGDVRRPVRMASLPAINQSDVVFSPDGRLLVSMAEPDGATDVESTELHVWDVTDPRDVGELGAPAVPGTVKDFDFSPDGTLVVSTAASDGGGGDAYLLDLDIDELTRGLCDAMGSQLTPTQWDQYFPGVPPRSTCG